MSTIVTGRIADVRRATDAARAACTVGFVPTMGALHDGHLSLIRRARSETGFVVVSIFVNPQQFGPHEDLGAYPRTLERDLEACEREAVDLVFAPEGAELYPEPPATRITVASLAATMEGRIRPGHFDGVALVVCKLCNIVGPCSAYFGEKDAQQLRVVRRMVRDLDLPVHIVGCPTVRDADGLALSSRNAYLTHEERGRALCLPRALRAAAEAAQAGERDAERVAARAREVLAEGRPDAIDYLDVVDPDSLEPLALIDRAALVCGAIRLGETRLIDNVLVGVREPATPGAKGGGA